MADLISTLDPARVLIPLYSAAGSGIVREEGQLLSETERSLCIGSRNTDSINRYIRRKDSRTEASAISTRSCSPRTSTRLLGKISRITQIQRVNDPLFTGAIFSFSLLGSAAASSCTNIYQTGKTLGFRFFACPLEIIINLNI